MKKLFYLMGSVAIIATFLYSFTQIDLSLTITKVAFLQNIQHSFQYIGYFNRSLSTVLFVTLVTVLFVFYGLSIWGVVKKRLLRRDVWIAIISSAIIFTFSYNAFSYDIFNYIFDAKIFTEYGDNPYEKKALDYPEDPMLSFMRWTHRTYPYGPTWLVATVPLSYAGLGYFVPTYALFKLLATAAFIGTAYVIEKIAELTKRKNTLLPLTLFALNPLVLIESLVSSHNDIVMIFFALAAILMYVERKYFFSGISLLISIGIKYATAAMLPAFIVYKLFARKKENYDLLFTLFTVMLILATCAATIRTTYQPWYLLYPLATAVFLGRRAVVLIPFIVLSCASLLLYAPYLFTGNWDPPVPLYMLLIMLGGVGISVLLITAARLLKMKGEV